MLKIKKLDNRGVTRLLVPILAVSLLAGIGSYRVFQGLANPPHLTGTEDINRISMHVGPEERIAGPSNYHDSTYTIQNFNDKWYGLTANGTTYKFELDPETLLPKKEAPANKDDIPASQVLLRRDLSVPYADRTKDTPRHPDGCGAWLLGSLYKFRLEPGHMIGWYHGEHGCARENAEDGNRTNMSLAFAESFDNGKTWLKPNYPNNRIITVEDALKNDVRQNDAGNGRIIKIGDYFYIFYEANSAQNNSFGRHKHVARSKVSDRGKPGTWKKWYCSDPSTVSSCNFNSQPGIGGKSTPIKNIGDRYVVFNRYLNRYISTNAHGDGFTLSAANGGSINNDQDIKNLLTSWRTKTEVFYPPVTHKDDTTVNNWERDNCSECKQLYAYNSTIGAFGNSRGSGRSFYIYYLKIFPGENFNEGYTMRRKVTLSLSDVTTKTTRVELSVYKNSAGRQRITTELPQPSTGFTRYDKKIGYVLGHHAAGYQPLFECQRPSGQFYLKLLNTTQPEAVPVPGNPPTKCNSTDKLARRVGWVSPTKTGEASVPIYDDSTSASSARGKPIGYALPL